MRSNRPDRESASQDVLKGLFEAEHRPNHDQKWQELSDDNPEQAAAALIQADQITDEDITLRDAYLRGVADNAAFERRLRLINSFKLPDNIPVPIDDSAA